MNMAPPSTIKVLDDKDIWDVKELSRVITPQDAVKLLDLNTNNRALRRGTVDRIKHDIANGRFMLNGDTIVVGANGELLNGQHRLEAIAAGGVPVESIIIKGVDPAAFSTIDNHRPRSLSDYMKINGISDHSRIAVLVPRAERWDAQQRGRDVASGTKRRGESVYIDFYEDNKERIDGAIRSPQKYPYIVSSITGIFRYIIGFERADECDKYLREVSSGDSTIESNRKVYAAIVREDNNNDSSKSHRVLGILISGWNARQIGKCVKKIPFDGGPLPEPI